MDEGSKISISIDTKYLERLLYWIIIVALAVLLIISWMKDSPKCDTTTGQQSDLKGPAAQEPATAPPAAQEPAAAPEPAAPAASCADATKNGDETDVDCGGSCDLNCANGRACTVDADCVSNICLNSTCAATRPPTLSGKLAFTIKNAEYSTAPAKDADNTTYNRVKVTGVKYAITNGLAADQEGFIAKVFVKNKAGTYCLNQQTQGTCDDPYATFTLGELASGKTIEQTHTFQDDEYTTKMGRFLTEGSGYDPADRTRDQFTVLVYLYGLDGEEIGGKAISASAEVNP